MYFCTTGNFYKNTQFSWDLKVYVILCTFTIVIYKSKYTFVLPRVYMFNILLEKQTIDMQTPTQDESVCISRREAEEYRAYKRKKLQADIVGALSHSESSILNGEDAQRVCERAIRLRQAAVKIPLTRLALASRYLAGSKVKLDCVVGGTGETLTKVKMLEARLAAKKKAAEITVVVAPSLVDGCRYGEITLHLSAEQISSCLSQARPPKQLFLVHFALSVC